MLTREEAFVLWLFGFICGIALTAFLAGVARTEDHNRAITAQAAAYDVETGEFVYGCVERAAR